MKKVSNIKSRIKELAENSGLTQDVFFNKIGSTSANFRGKKLETGVNSDLIDKIVSLYPNTDLHWLITGNVKNPTNESREPDETYEVGYKQKYYDLLEENRELRIQIDSLKNQNRNGSSKVS